MLESPDINGAVSLPLAGGPRAEREGIILPAASSIGQTLEGSFPAVLKPNFARKYSLELATRWKALAEIYTMHSFAPLSNLKIFVKNR